jgi:hypothetical protein
VATTWLNNGLAPAARYDKAGPLQGFSRVPASWGFSIDVKSGHMVLADSKPFNAITLLS